MIKMYLGVFAECRGSFRFLIRRSRKENMISDFITRFGPEDAGGPRFFEDRLLATN